ncbi:MAG: potassium-transporting ATPase subunit F [Gemmatimonadales bacterium]|nr:potassium-transporting ATPase subunit F [Gemmatimonadales bacterium]
MSVASLSGLAVALAVLAYLLHTLLRPKRF